MKNLHEDKKVYLVNPTDAKIREKILRNIKKSF